MSSPVRRWSLVALALALGPAARGEPPARTDLYGDPLPPGAIARLGTVRWRSAGEIGGMDFHPDGKHLITAFDTMSVWDLSTGRVVRTAGPRGLPPEENVGGFEFTPDGKRVLSVSRSGGPFFRTPRKARLLVWDFATGRLLARSPDLDENAGHIAFRNDGRLAACVNDRKVLLWGPGEKAFRPVFRLRKGEVVSEIAFRPDGKQLIVLSGSTDGHRVRWVEIGSGRLLKWVTFRADYNLTRAPDCSTGATCTGPGQLYLYDLATGARRRLPLKEKDDYFGLSFSPDGRVFLGWDRWAETADLWDVTKGQLLRRVRLPGLRRTSEHATLLLSPDGTTLASYEGRSVVRLWDARTGLPRLRLPGHAIPPHYLAFSADGLELVSYSYRGDSLSEALRWEAATGKHLGQVVPEAPTDGFAFNHSWLLTPDGRHLAEGLPGAVRLYDTRTGRKLDLPGRIPRDVGWSMTPDGRALVTTGPGRSVRLWDVTTGKLQRRLELEKKGGPISWLRFSPDGRTVVTGEGWRKVHLWDPATGKHQATLTLPAGRDPFQPPLGDWQIAFTSDGRYLFVSSTTNLWVWDLVARREIGPYESDEYKGSVVGSGQVAVSPDGRLLAWFDEAWNLRLYEVCTGRIVHRFADEHYWAVAFAPSGWRLATGCHADASVLVWDLPLLFRSPVPDKDARPEALWNMMASDDAAEAHRALWRLAALPGADAFLARRLTEVERVSPERLRPLLADLGSPDFDRRRRAEEALASAGEAARAALAEAAAGAKDPDVRRRVARLRTRLRPPEARRLREVRAVMALEARSTPEARRLLEKLAGGAPEARLTQEAKAALRRWRAAPPSGG